MPPTISSIRTRLLLPMLCREGFENDKKKFIKTVRPVRKKRRTEHNCYL